MPPRPGELTSGLFLSVTDLLTDLAGERNQFVPLFTRPSLTPARPDQERGRGPGVTGSRGSWAQHAPQAPEPHPPLAEPRAENQTTSPRGGTGVHFWFWVRQRQR